MAKLENLNLNDEPLPDCGWSSFLELDALIDKALALDIDDDPLFAEFCAILRSW